MSNVTVERIVAHPIAAVWEALADTAGVYRFHPLVKRSPLEQGTPPQGVGSERTCHFYDGNHVKERVVDSVHRERLQIEIIEGSMPLRTAKATLEISSRPGEHTQVRMTMRYEPKFGLLGKVMDSLMMRRKFTGMMTLLLEALDEHLRTGDIIESGFTPARAA